MVPVLRMQFSSPCSTKRISNDVFYKFFSCLSVTFASIDLTLEVQKLLFIFFFLGAGFFV